MFAGGGKVWVYVRGYVHIASSPGPISQFFNVSRATLKRSGSLGTRLTYTHTHTHTPNKQNFAGTRCSMNLTAETCNAMDGDGIETSTGMVNNIQVGERSLLS